MSVGDPIQQIQYAFNHFSDIFEDDVIAVLRWIDRHKSELEWVQTGLPGDAGTAATDLLKLLESKSDSHRDKPTLAIDVKRDLAVIVNANQHQTAVVSVTNRDKLNPETIIKSSVDPNKEIREPKRRDFLQWAQFIVMLVGVLVGTSTGVIGRVQAVTSDTANGPKSNTPLPLQSGPAVPVILHLSQAAIIFLFILLYQKRFHDLANKLTDAVPIAKKTLQQFKFGWLWLWYGWFVLYSWFSFAAILFWQGHGSHFVESISDILDAISGFAIWWCFFVLEIPSVSLPPHESDRDKTFWKAVWLTAFVCITCASLAVLDRQYHWGFFGVALVGLFNALALASLTGRLSSHYIGLPRWMLLFLYTYSMLQVFYSFLPVLDTDLWTPAIFILALIFKMVFALAGAHMMQKGGLLRYLDAAQSGLLGKIEDKAWEAMKAAARNVRAPSGGLPA